MLDIILTNKKLAVAMNMIGNAEQICHIIQLLRANDKNSMGRYIVRCSFLNIRNFLCFIFLKILFIYLRERERERAHEPREEQRERKIISSRLCTECRTPYEAQSQDPEIMTRAETKSQMPNQLSHPGAP